MPITRASTRRQIENNLMGDNDSSNVHHSREDIEEDIGLSILDNLREARSGVEKLNNRIRFLERENGRLRSELHHNVPDDADRNLRSKEKTCRRRIQSLERTVASLQAAREKDRRAIEKLRDTEVEQDARELADNHDGVTPTRQTNDLGESATRLLRRMCDTIDMNTLAEGEECAICMEKMEVGKCYSLPCRHPVCIECFERLGDASDMVSDHEIGSVRCPHCREISPRGEYETITHTAVQQWDLLLDISGEWAAMDIAEIKIEDEDDSFIDDGSVAATGSSCLTETPEEQAGLDPQTSTASTSPNDTETVAYKSLPSPLKRKRLTELVARRAVKQKL